MRYFTLKTLAVVLCYLSTGMLFAQVNLSAIDSRLIDMYGNERVQEMKATQPQFIDYMNYYVKNGYTVVYEIPAHKLASFEDISTITNSKTGNPITIEDLDNLNILVLDIQRKNDEYLTYKVGETGTVVVFIAPKNLLEEYKMTKVGEGRK